MIMGKEKPDTGTITVGETVQLSYIDQSHEQLQDGNKTVYDAVSEGNDFLEIGNATINSRAYLSRFNFAGSDQQKKSRCTIWWRAKSPSTSYDTQRRWQCIATG